MVIPEWVHLWHGDRAHSLYNPLNLAVLRLDDEAADLVARLRRAGPLNRESAAAMGLGAAEYELLAAEGFLLPPGQNTAGYRRQEVEAARQAESSGAADRQIRAARLVLTQACNLRCEYCFVPNEGRLQMSLETALAAAERLIQLSGGDLEQLQFFGGEPLLRIDLIRAVVGHLDAQKQAGRVARVHYALTTNGTLITPELAGFFAAHRFAVDVSLDGFRDTHDRYRRFTGGRGSFDQAVAGLRTLQQAGVDAGLIITPTQESVAGLTEFVAYAIRKLGARSISINTPQPGPDGWQVDGSLLANQIIAATALAEREGVLISSAAGRVVAAVDGRRPYYFSCLRGSGSLGVSVAPDGAVSPCDVAWEEEITVGSLDQLAGSRALESWKLLPHRTPEECLGCFALPTCGGPCPLDLHYNPDDARTNQERCRFFREITRWAVDRSGEPV